MSGNRSILCAISSLILGVLLIACSARVPAHRPVAVAPPPESQPPTQPTEFSFVVASDSHAVLKNGDHDVALNQTFVKDIDFLKGLPGDFIIVTGDIVDGYAKPDVLEAMWKQFADLEKRFDRELVLVPGNHDIYDVSSEKIWREHNGPTYRSFDHDGSHFVILDSEDQAAPQRIEGAQLAWLASDLDKHAAARHTFVFVHRPLWIDAPENWDAKVHPLLARHKVDTVFAGHWHQYRLCPTRDGVRYVIASSIGREDDGVGGFLSALPVHVTNAGTTYRVVEVDGTVLPPVVVRRDFLVKTEHAVHVEPVENGDRPREASVTLEVDNPLEVPITGTARLVVDGTQWRAAESAIDVPPARKTAVKLVTSPGKPLLPLPRLDVELAAGESRLEKRDFLVNVAELPTVETRTLDDFEDGNLLSSAKAARITRSNGPWRQALDSFGSKISAFGVEKLAGDGEHGSALHVAGYHGVSHDPNWCWALIQNFLVAPDKEANLAPSIGISFRARADRPSTVWLMVEGTVNGVRVTGEGVGHRVEFEPSTKWATYTFFWQGFEQPDWACPGEHCANGPLTVDKVEAISWSFRDEGKPFDLWLDDVKLVYEKK